MTQSQPFSEAKSVCDTCRGVLHAFDTAPDGRVLGVTAQRLETRAAEGCRLCALFLGTTIGDYPGTRALAHDFYQEHGHRGEIVATYSKQNVYSSYGSLNVYIGNRSSGSSDERGVLASLAVMESSKLEAAPTDRLWGSSTGSMESLDLARRWIEECKANHVNCRETTKKSFRPTRLIDIGDTASDVVRLCLGKDVPNARYFTLSHCWGSKPMPVRLLQDNLQSMFVQIEYEKLPQNFQDAIYIARNLGGRYLWIDSLCIIQDSDEDWQHEAALMGEVYSHGMCNLSAVDSKDSSVGMIYKREPAEVFALGFPSGNEKQEIYLCDPRIWFNQIVDGPLLKRGWVCQERLLSSGNLHFGRNMVFWECGSQTACETFPNGLPVQLEKFANEPLVKRKAAKLIRSSSDFVSRSLDDTSHPLQLWNQVLELYTGCQLSFGTDKLIAVAGLAAIAHRNFSKNYLAGLWEEYLPFQLLWDLMGNPIRSPPPSYRAPTWSWAAADAGILSHKTCSACTSLIEVIDAHVDLVGPNPYGQVKNGYIEIKCSLNTARMTEYEWLRPTFFESSALPSWDYEPSVEDKQDTFYLVPVCGGTYSMPEDSPQRHALNGLILAEAKDREGCFVRRGVFFMDDEDPGDLLKSCRRFAKAHIGSDLKSAGDGSGQFVITIL